MNTNASWETKQDLDSARCRQTAAYHTNALMAPLLDQEKMVGALFIYVREKPGKNTRRMLIDTFNEWFQVSEQDLTIIKMVVNVLHTASLL
jgi:uncharacterized protein YtpQ (UPF0354 family)